MTLDPARYPIFGTKDTQRYAHAAFPIVVRQARAGVSIEYAVLAAEAGMPHHRPIKDVLWHIGRTQLAVAEDLGLTMPPLMAIAVNKKDGLPGSGLFEAFEGVVCRWLGTREEYEVLSKVDQKQKLHVLHEALAAEGAQWDRVLKHLGYPPEAAHIPVIEMERVASQWSPRGESEAHRRLKEYIAQHPEAVDIKGVPVPGETEHEFCSADRADVLFKSRTMWYTVEVKPQSSPPEDILRGIYQCCKYEALMIAEQRHHGHTPSAKAILALGGPLPAELRAVANTLGVEVHDNIQPTNPGS